MTMHQDHYDQEDVDRTITYGDLRAIVKDLEEKYPLLQETFNYRQGDIGYADSITREAGIAYGELRTYYGARFLLEK